MANMSLRAVLAYLRILPAITRACVQCWRIYEYFMLKQCLENIGEGLLHAGISSLYFFHLHSWQTAIF
jgi:hypothetical protein